MERLMTWAMRHSLLVLVAVAIVTVLAASQLRYLEVAISPQSLIMDGDPEQQFYEDTLRTFGSDRITILYLADERLLEPDRLKAISEVVGNIERLPFVARTLSLFNVPDVRVDDELVTSAPFLATFPLGQEATRQFRDRALNNPFVRKNLLSADGHAMAVNVYLKNGEYEENPDFDAHVARRLREALSPLAGVVAEHYQIGLPYVRSAIVERVADEQLRILSAALGVLLLSLWLMFRRIGAVLIPTVTGGLSIVWLLGAMAALDVPLSILTALVPVLLVIVGSTEDVHLLAETYDGRRRGLSLAHAIRKSIRNLGLAIGLTFVTSYFGFLAVAGNPIGLVREFGLVASSGLAINFALTALLVPVLLKIAAQRRHERRQRRDAALLDRVGTKLTPFILRFRGIILLAALAVMGGFIYAASSLQINNSILNYFDAASPVKQRTESLQSRLAGLYTLQVVVDGHIDGVFTRVEYLDELRKIQHYIARHPLLDHSVSFADYLAVLNSAVNDSGSPELPEDDDVVETLMLFVNADDVSEYVSFDQSKANIFVRHGIAESSALSGALRDLRAFISQQVNPDLDVTVTGESVLTDNAVGHLMIGQLHSLGLVIAVIFGVSALLFVTAKAGLIALVVNAFPIAGLFGVMSLSGIPLDSATSMIAVLALGIGVDHTVHFMVRYNLHCQTGADEFTALSNTLRDELRPIAAASMALAAGFATLAVSAFPPIAYFGYLSATAMLFAFVATVVLTPVLLSYIRLTTIWEMLGTRIRHELQQNCALFRGMSVLQIRRIITLGQVRRYGHDETVVQRGDSGHEFFVVLDGQVELGEESSAAGERRVKTAAVGDVFGIASLMEDKPRRATATAVGRAEVLALDWNRLQRVARFFPRSAYHLFRNLAVITGKRLAGSEAAAIHRLPARFQVLSRDAFDGRRGVGT